MPFPVREFECHSTYIHDYTCFELVKKLGLQEAFDLLTASPWVRGEKPGGWAPTDRATRIFDEPEAYFLHNKGWSVVEVDRQKGLVIAVYNHDGRYSLWQAGMQSFMDRINQSRMWHRVFNRLWAELAQPHEHA